MPACAQCGGAFAPLPYAIRPDGSRICYVCADAEQIAEVLADERAPIFAYWDLPPLRMGDWPLPSRYRVTTWTGGALPLTITQWAEHDDYRSGGYGARNRYATGRARDSRGRSWTFRAAVDNGNYIKLRPIKGEK